MRRKVFVSYKYADNDVKPLFLYSTYYRETTVRDYVTDFQNVAEQRGIIINKGERDNEDMSQLTEETIRRKLYDRIYDSTITVVFISPNMKESFKPEKYQWIPREIQYSLREQSRSDRTSHANALVFVVLPDRLGSYQYFYRMDHFNIVKSNIDNGYGVLVEWIKFRSNITGYFEKALYQQSITPDYKIEKSI